MQNNSRFIAVDPSKIHKKNRNARQFQCQTCFNFFGTHQELRDHIADYQSEQQRLTVRLLEAQAHLPPKKHAHEPCHGEPTREICGDHNEDDVDSEWDTEGDVENDGNADNNGDETEGKSDEDKTGDRPTSYPTDDVHASLQCPYLRCHSRTRFETRVGLQRHYESHVRCHEICVFCRQLYKQIRKFLRHTCRAREKADDEAKEFYQRERRAQLKRFSAAKLSRTLASSNTKDKQTKKRTAEQVDSSIPMSASKKRKERPAEVVFTTNEKLHEYLPWQAEDTMQPPLFSSSSLNGTNSLTNVSNTTFPPKVLSYGQIEPNYNVLAPQPYAPIFDDITITPCYDLVQESYTFSSDLQNANYPMIPQHEAGRVLPNSDERGLD